MPVVRANGIDLYYEQHGQGPDVVLIMGLAGHSGAWLQQVPALAKKLRVTVFDNRGCGRSSAPDVPYSTTQMAQDTAALMGALGLKTAHVVGASMGGMIAQELVLARPDLVDRLVLMCSRARAGKSRRALAAGFGALYDVDLDAADRLLVTMPWIYTPALMGLPARVEALLDFIRHDPFPMQAAPYRRQLHAATEHDALDRLGAVTAPTLVLVGAEDVLTPVPESIELARAIPGAQLEILPRGGHGFFGEYAADVNRSLLNFLG